MSKNFELLQQAEVKPKVPPALAPAPEPRTTFRVSNGGGNGHTRGVRLGLDKVTREESLKLVQSVFLLKGKESPRAVMFAGIDSGNGCSGICAHAAEVLAGQVPGTVCLVDANLHAPSLPEFFGVTNHFGLTDALRKDGSIRDFAKQVRPDNLWLLSCGSFAAESSGLLNSELMKARVAELRKEFDYVLIDSPPLSAYADGVALGQLADALVLVLEANSTRREAAARVAENLRAAQIRIVGAVLNKRTFPIPEPLYQLL
jgi:succinoglycan biosynthesis transport protein ExoP